MRAAPGTAAGLAGLWWAPGQQHLSVTNLQGRPGNNKIPALLFVKGENCSCGLLPFSFSYGESDLKEGGSAGVTFL